jgi:hypothetical protein
MRITLLLVLFSITPVLAQEGECVFDQSTQTDDFIKDKGVFTDYVWDADKKEATIRLDDGNILKAYRGGCMHFGMSGELEIKNTDVELFELSYWFDKAVWIARNLFDETDAEYLETQIARENYLAHTDIDSIYIIIPHETYDEFTVSVHIKDGSVFLYVGYYFS